MQVCLASVSLWWPGALLLTYLACVSQGRRVRSWVDESQERPMSDSQKVAATLLLALHSSVAFNPSSQGGDLGVVKTTRAPSHVSRGTPPTAAISTAPSDLQSADVQTEDPPTTLLGGFLGAGKTTALTHMLTNREGLKIAVLVNDVASVNVDAATMRRRTIDADGVDMVELENGCVCCGPGAGELAPAVERLRSRRGDDGSSAFDHVVIELSGVADPTNVEKNLNVGGVVVARKVALVDANAFPGLYNSVSRMGDRSDLAGEGVELQDPCAVDRKVIELLLDQIESADVILVNKCDLASDEELRTTLAACRALNSEAKIVSTTYGDAQIEAMLPFEKLSDESQGAACAGPDCQDTDCADPDCTAKDDSSESPDAKCIGADCKDTDCADPGCKGKDSDKSTDSECIGADCKDTNCADPDCDANAKNSVDSIGFQTYVYRARRPFSQQRLVKLIRSWPLPRKKMLSIENIASPGAEGLAADGKSKDPTFANVLRSKGTTWLETQHRTAADWSHAGRHFTLNPAGPWWTTLPPEIMRAALSASGENTTEESDSYKAEKSKFSCCSGFGDRRQEIVFIGTNLDTDKIKDVLDACLLTDEEMEQYNVIWSLEEERMAAENGPFRFELGARVECNMGDEWAAGTIVKHYYREAGWPVGQWTPYQVFLEPDGPLIFAPADSDACVRRA